MRRFSQRNPLVTLNDINITPLLDLAFVLLIIFVITTPMLENSMNLTLPTGGPANSTVSKHDVLTISVSLEGWFQVRNQREKLSLQDLENVLMQEFRANPELALYIRADGEERYKTMMAIMDVCRKHGITRMKFATAPERN